MESKDPNVTPLQIISRTTTLDQDQKSTDKKRKKRLSKTLLSINSPMAGSKRVLEPVNAKDDHFFDHMNHQYLEVSLHIRSGLTTMKHYAAYVEKLCISNKPVDAQQVAQRQRRKSDTEQITGAGLCEDLLNSKKLSESYLCNSMTYHAAFIKSVHRIVPPLQKFYKENMIKLTELDQKHRRDLEKIQKIRKKLNHHRRKRQKEINELKEALIKKNAGKKTIFDSYSRKVESVRKQLTAYEKEWGESMGQDCEYQQNLQEYMGQMENIEKARIQIMQDSLGIFNKASLDLADSMKREADELANGVNNLSVGLSLAQMLDTWETQYGTPPTHQQIPYGLSCQAQDLDKGEFDKLPVQEIEHKTTEPIFEVTIVSANGLRVADANGKSDPYCKLVITDPTKKNNPNSKATKNPEIIATGQSEVINGSLSPTWNKTFKFEEPSILRSISGDKWANIVIHFEVWDHDTLGTHDFLGECTMEAGHDFLLGEVKTKTVPLSSNKEKAKENATGSLSIIIHIENVDYLHDKEQFQFGRSIAYINTKKIEDYSAEIPEVLYLMQQHILQNNGLDIEGIFRLAPDGAERDLVKSELNRCLPTECEDPIVMADLIKIWFRDQPDKLFTAKQLEVEYKEPEKIQSLFDSLEDPNLSVFKWLIDLCVTVVNNKEKNKMSPKNLGIVIGPNLIPETENLLQQAVLVKGASSLVENSIILFAQEKTLMDKL